MKIYKVKVSSDNLSTEEDIKKRSDSSIMSIPETTTKEVQNVEKNTVRVETEDPIEIIPSRERAKRNEDSVDDSGTIKHNMFAIPAAPLPKSELTVGHNKSALKCPYEEPGWGGPTPHQYYVTVLKDGTVKDVVSLECKSFVTFGRCDDTDVRLEHPSCSRFQAVLQYSVKEEGKRRTGFYLYDLGSTHGTFMNKELIKPRVYYRLYVGYQLRFGGSSRLYIIEGPDFDMEKEIEMDIMKVPADKKPKEKNFANSTADSSNYEGASWGFGEDAADDSFTYEDLVIKKNDMEVQKDAKKTLKNFFEHEGLTLSYDTNERGSGHSLVHVAQVRLPLDVPETNNVIAEGVSSNKKEAMKLCAEDACKMIKAYQTMSRSASVNHRQKMREELEENDFYHEDEDTFWDRTGTVEKKRLKRKQLASSRNYVDFVDTHETLKVQLEKSEKELERCKDIINRDKAARESNSGDDSLDNYMNTIKDSLDSNSRTKIQMKQVKRLKKLVERTKPTLPSIKYLKFGD